MEKDQINTDMSGRKAYLIGGGLASLSAAFYLIKDGKIPGKNITIYEEYERTGGSLDAIDHPEHNAYIMRGFRMLEDKVYSALFDLLSFVPSVEEPDRTVLEVFNEFNRNVKTLALSRLIRDGRAINARPFRMKFPDRIKLLLLLITPEKRLENKRIQDNFSPDFFISNFWFAFSTTFSFLPWHSLIEMKRYILRFIQCSHQMDTQECIRSTPFNQYESIILPVKNWLKNKGVVFRKNCSIGKLDFDGNETRKSISGISVNNGTGIENVSPSPQDLVFISIGSITADSTFGSMDSPPDNKPATNPGKSWRLWESIAVESPMFGNPAVFNSNKDLTGWVSFTVTQTDQLFLNLLKEITRREPGTEGPITLIDSNWLLSFAIPFQPHFFDQDPKQVVFWGYGLFPDKKGNFINKKMGECSGREIMIELLHHLKFSEHLDKILEHTTCIPCLMPYITSQFMPRKKGDRPQVVPECSRNFAFIGQFCEIPDDIVFTLEQSVRSAQIATFRLLNINKKPTPIYKGQYRPRIILKTVRTVFR